MIHWLKLNLFFNLTSGPNFGEYYNHRYSANNSKSPIEQRRFLGSNFKLDKRYTLPEKIFLEEGEIIVIRFIRSDLKLNVFGEIYLMKEKLMYSYVEAIILIKDNKLIVKRDLKIEHVFDYFITSPF